MKTITVSESSLPTGSILPSRPDCSLMREQAPSAELPPQHTGTKGVHRVCAEFHRDEYHGHHHWYCCRAHGDHNRCHKCDCDHRYPVRHSQCQWQRDFRPDHQVLHQPGDRRCGQRDQRYGNPLQCQRQYRNCSVRQHHGSDSGYHLLLPCICDQSGRHHEWNITFLHHGASAADHHL